MTWEKVYTSHTSELSLTRNNNLTNMRNSQKMSHQENVQRLPIASSVPSLMSMRGIEMPVRMEIAKRTRPVLIKGLKKSEPTCC